VRHHGNAGLAVGLCLAKELDVGPLRRRELTAAGHERIERTLDELLTHEQRLLAGLAEAERDRLEEALRALLATLEDHLER
jgi:hypothetical protein